MLRVISGIIIGIYLGHRYDLKPMILKIEKMLEEHKKKE